MTDFDTRVDPELTAPLAALSTLQLPTRVEDTTAFRERERALTVRTAPDPAIDVADSALLGSGVLVRTYRPVTARTESLPAIYWIHGGAYIAGSVDMYDSYCTAMALATNTVVVTVDYRKAPEHPYPTPFDDCYDGLVWVTDNADAIGADIARVAIAGASAGGGLALAVALRARDEHGPRLTFQYLAYPAIDDRMSTPSMREFGELPVCDRRNTAVAWQAYLGPLYGADDVPSYAAPARETDLTNLPPALVQAAELDVFRDESIRLAAALSVAGVGTELHTYPATYHGFDLLNPDAASTKRWYQERDDALRSALHSGD